MSAPAPVLGQPGTAAQALFPAGFNALKAFIYPFINNTNLAAASGDSTYGMNASSYLPPHAQDGSAQPAVPAGGAPGGNPHLWDVMFTVTATVTNTGPIAGDEVAQLYISLGGPNDPKVVLRNFDRIHIASGQSATFSAQITRRDISNWDPAAQNWYISTYPKTVYVGNSSRNLPLSVAIPLNNISGDVGGDVATATYSSEAAAASSIEMAAGTSGVPSVPAVTVTGVATATTTAAPAGGAPSGASSAASSGAPSAASSGAPSAAPSAASSGAPGWGYHSAPGGGWSSGGGGSGGW